MELKDVLMNLWIKHGFYLQRDVLDDTDYEDIMKAAIMEEEYELCQLIKQYNEEII